MIRTVPSEQVPCFVQAHRAEPASQLRDAQENLNLRAMGSHVLDVRACTCASSRLFASESSRARAFAVAAASVRLCKTCESRHACRNPTNLEPRIQLPVPLVFNSPGIPDHMAEASKRQTSMMRLLCSPSPAATASLASRASTSCVSSHMSGA